jgi:hypothetical protein
LQLKPARFDYIAGEKNNLGFIAQDVQPVIPEAVVVANQTTGMLGLKTDFILPYLVGAIQEQQGQIDSLKLQLNRDGMLNATGTVDLAAPSPNFVQMIANALQSLGMVLQDGVANLKGVVASVITSDLITSKKSVTEQMCVKDSGNSDICLTGDQLKELIQRAGSSSTMIKTNPPAASDVSATTTEAISGAEQGDGVVASTTEEISQEQTAVILNQIAAESASSTEEVSQ